MLSSCISASHLWDGPAPHSMPMDVPGPPEYKEGYKDGCQSGMATYGPVQYKLYYNYYQNYGMLKDKYYVTAWHEAFDFCRHFTLKYHTQGEGLLSSNLLVKFIPGRIGMAEGYAALLGQKKPIFQQLFGFDIDTAHGPDYKEGWEDGCETGATVFGDDNNKAIQRARNKSFVRNTDKVGNQNYESAWWDAYNFCRQQHNTHFNNWDRDWYGIFDLQ